MIIHETLYDLFPPSTFDPALTSPLTHGDFIQYVLIPEVGLRLIMEDRDLVGHRGAVEALRTLRESVRYGVVMFPEEGSKDGEVDSKGEGVADKVFMERAMKRRREQEDEGETLSKRVFKKRNLD
jgi:RTC4-like domain